MKKWLSFMLSLILLLCLLSVGAFTVSAGFEDKVFGAFTYNVVEDQVVIIDVQTDISGDVVVPSSIEGYPVTGIGELAFDGCDLMATLKIPAKVKQVEDTAFESCTALTEIKVAFGNQSYCAWNGVLFNKNRTTLVCYPAGKTDTAYAIPDGVKQIAVSAFAEASKLQSITIADTVGKLGEKAFFGCSGLNKVVFGVGLTAIGPEAFADCTSLESITVPNSVDDLGRAAFSGCSKLSEVTLGRGLRAVNGALFLNCVGLQNIGIPANVKSVESSAFAGCKGLTSITIPDTVTGIGSYAFNGCDNLKTILYTGAETDKSTIKVGAKNEILDSAEWQYNAPSVKAPLEDTPVGRQSDGYVLWRWASIGGIVLVPTAIIVAVLIFLIKGIKQRK